MLTIILKVWLSLGVLAWCWVFFARGYAEWHWEQMGVQVRGYNVYGCRRPRRFDRVWWSRIVPIYVEYGIDFILKSLVAICCPPIIWVKAK